MHKHFATRALVLCRQPTACFSTNECPEAHDLMQATKPAMAGLPYQHLRRDLLQYIAPECPAHWCLDGAGGSMTHALTHPSPCLQSQLPQMQPQVHQQPEDQNQASSASGWRGLASPDIHIHLSHVGMNAYWLVCKQRALPCPELIADPLVPIVMIAHQMIWVSEAAVMHHVFLSCFANKPSSAHPDVQG